MQALPHGFFFFHGILANCGGELWWMIQQLRMANILNTFVAEVLDGHYTSNAMTSTTKSLY